MTRFNQIGGTWLSTSASLVFFATAMTATPASEFETASKEATQNYTSKVGQRYRDAFMKVVEPKLATVLGPCSGNTPDTKEPAEIIFVIAADGRVKRVLSSPGIPFGECVASKLGMISAPPPPYDSWPAAIGVANHWHEERAAGPPDTPRQMSKKELAAYDEAIAPYVAKARATYPTAKKHFLAGLPPGHIFTVRVPLINHDGKREDAFIEVKSIKNGEITGVINSQLTVATDYKTGQKITFRENQIDNWLILHPEGTEEGNDVGKFLDTYKPK